MIKRTISFEAFTLYIENQYTDITGYMYLCVKALAVAYSNLFKVCINRIRIIQND